MKNKNKKWTRPRHTLVRNLLSITLGVYTKLRYRIKVEKHKEKEQRQYLILYNHQTAFDQNFVGMAFKRPIYYLASEDLFSNGFVSSLIKYLVAPIPIKKQTTDLAAIRNCMKVAAEGGTIAIAPEGNRTYSGKTEYMSPAIASLARRLKLPIVLYKIEGGYGVHPRWSDVIRRGKMRAYVSRILEPEEYADMSSQELADLIERELYVNEGVNDAEFFHRRRAEYLERAVYYCPKCGLSEFRSDKTRISCQRCGITAEYTERKELVGVNCEFPYRYVTEWYDAQYNYVNSIDVTKLTDAPLYTDTVRISEVIPYKRKIKLSASATSRLYGDRIDVSGDIELLLPFEKLTAVSVLGKNKVNLYTDENKVYQIKGSKRFNALRYVNFYYRHHNIVRGEENVRFLGL